MFSLGIALHWLTRLTMATYSISLMKKSQYGDADISYS